MFKMKEIPGKGRPHIGIYTLQIESFSPNTATKFHGRRQPCRGILSCLVKKSLVLECFAVLNRRFFFTAATGDRVNTGCIPRETGAVVEEKIHSKPCKSLCESAQGSTFFVLDISIYLPVILSKAKNPHLKRNELLVGILRPLRLRSGSSE